MIASLRKNTECCIIISKLNEIITDQRRQALYIYIGNT